MGKADCSRKTGYPGITEREPGKYDVVASAGYRRDGKQRRLHRVVTGTIYDAVAVKAELLAELGGCSSAGDDVTLAEYFYTDFLPLRRATTTNANVRCHDSAFRCHIAPAFGDRPIRSITNTQIQRWVNGLPPQSARNIVRSLRAILNQAAFDHVIPSSPMERYRFKMPKGRDNSPLPVWGPAEVAECLERLEGDVLYPLWLCMVGCGLSKSEALALEWGESIVFAEETGMDGSTRRVAVLDVVAAYTASDGLKDTKNTRRIRRVPMRPLFAEPLWRCSMESGPVCPGPNGRMTPNNVSRRWRHLFDEGGALHGLPYVQLNRMRATYATLMQAAGIDRTIINSMQGRSDDSQVLYSNYLNPNMDVYAASAGAMERLVAG